MEENLILVGTFVEQNTNADILLIMASILLLPALAIALARYAKIVITGKDFKFFQKR